MLIRLIWFTCSPCALHSSSSFFNIRIFFQNMSYQPSWLMSCAFFSISYVSRAHVCVFRLYELCVNRTTTTKLSSEKTYFQLLIEMKKERTQKSVRKTLKLRRVFARAEHKCDNRHVMWFNGFICFAFLAHRSISVGFHLFLSCTSAADTDCHTDCHIKINSLLLLLNREKTLSRSYLY